MLKPFPLSCSFASSWREYGKDEPSKYVLSVQVKPADILVINLHQKSRDRIKRNGVLKIVIIMRVRFVCYQSCRLVFRRSTVQIWTGDSIQIEMIMHFLSPQTKQVQLTSYSLQASLFKFWKFWRYFGGYLELSAVCQLLYFYIPRFLTKPLKMFCGTLIGKHWSNFVLHNCY